ncbi:serologically defined colon cancer antigen 8 homolog isoform X1 [Oncorhynchus keta]|uniref:serologically defined colon cancer antigen 8 homolog isoform X1 n=1 Tax=Oncorhynchus keta TaxID=8018 RepID=UPI0015FADAA0|nr:serologically defined colon cancer antigen 8 homolog isoform X1 [Oncorhynchus keta]
MKPLLDSDEEEEELGAYQKKLRERANRSIQQLSSALEEPSSDAEGMEPGRAGDTDSTTGEDSWNQRQQSEAVNQLRSLLQKQQKETLSLPSPSKRKSSPKRCQDDVSSSMPAVKDLVPILHNQSEYIQHLEAEVKFCKEELLGMKQRIRVVVVENEKLHGEIKSKLVEDTLKDYTLLDGTVNSESPREDNPQRTAFIPAHIVFQQAEEHKWKKELEQLKSLYLAQTETLEAQVRSLNKNLASSQKECEEVKGRLRHKEAMAAAGSAKQCVGGLCLKCAQNEAVLAETHSNMHIQAIERLTKERDELMSVLCSLRASQSEAQQREWAAYQQVKQAVEMAEEANLEKTRAVVQCEAFARELARQRERLETEMAAEQEKISEAREVVRNEALKQKETLAQTVASLSQRVAELEGQLARQERERGSLSTQLDETLRKLTSQEQDTSKVCGELRYRLSQAQLNREEAERELRDCSSKTTRQLQMTEQEVEKLGVELSVCRQRLDQAQRDAGRLQAEALSLTERLGRAEHQLHLTRQEKESAERCRGEDMDALTFSAQQREQELTQRLQQMEAQHERSVGELEALLSSQNALIGKLKDECLSLGTKLETLTETSRREVEQLSLEKDHLEESVGKLRARCTEMEEQCVQHGRMHQRMKNRLQQLDQHSQSSAQQVMELLAKQNLLMQERHLLTGEMQNLRIQLPAGSRRPDTLST